MTSPRTPSPAITSSEKRTQQSRLYPVILAGGGGVRLWPESTPEHPKQFLRVGKTTMLERTYRRIGKLAMPERIRIVTARRYRNQVRTLFPEMRDDRIMCEPYSRNTAAAIGYAALDIMEEDADAIMLVLPSDHMITPVREFQRSVRAAVRAVAGHSGRLVTFGIVPEYPATQFGYIEYDSPISGTAQNVPFRVASFHEKPDRATAERYLARGNFCWNSGMFVWRASTILASLARYEPEIYDTLLRIKRCGAKPGGRRRVGELYAGMKSVSIDCAVLERSNDVAMIKAAFHWDDLGSFDALARYDATEDERHNLVTGANVVTLDASGNIVRNRDSRTVALLGVENLLVVETPDALLIASRELQARIPELLKQAGISFRPEGKNKS